MLLYVLFWYCTKAFPWSCKFGSNKGMALAVVKHENVRNARKMSAMSALYKILQVVYFPENYQQLLECMKNILLWIASFATPVFHTTSQLTQVFLR